MGCGSMIVKCKINKVIDLPSDVFNEEIKDKSKKYNLTIGSTHIVYAMRLYKGYMWYFLSNGYIVKPYPSPLFTIADGRLSKYWLYSFEEGNNKENQELWIGYPELVNIPEHFSGLMDMNKKDGIIFFKYKEKMDFEFPDQTIKISASILDNNWLMCPICIDGWESRSTDGMVICPKCQTVMHNPRYTEVAYLE